MRMLGPSELQQKKCRWDPQWPRNHLKRLISAVPERETVSGTSAGLGVGGGPRRLCRPPGRDLQISLQVTVPSAASWSKMAHDGGVIGAFPWSRERMGGRR